MYQSRIFLFRYLHYSCRYRHLCVIIISTRDYISCYSFYGTYYNIYFICSDQGSSDLHCDIQYVSLCLIFMFLFINLYYQENTKSNCLPDDPLWATLSTTFPSARRIIYLSDLPNKSVQYYHPPCLLRSSKNFSKVILVPRTPDQIPQIEGTHSMVIQFC